MNSHSVAQRKSRSATTPVSQLLNTSRATSEVKLLNSQSHWLLARTPQLDRDRLIAEAAYHHAEARGFEPGHELDDWLLAEDEVDARLDGEGRAY
jgi:hypothetical protein